MTQHMSQSPDPVSPGNTIHIHYAPPFPPFPFTLTVYGEPCGSVKEFPIRSLADLPIKIMVPDGCEGGMVEDSSGNSDDFAIQVGP